jgi:UDPglucose 6-dehydrogenase
MRQNIGVIGTGYVGLVTGTCLADVGNTVVCVDVDPRKVESLSKGQITIYEPGVEEVLQRTLAAGNISFTLDLAYAVEHCDVLMFCLPTPPGKDGFADLRAVMNVAKRVAEILVEKNIQSPSLIVNKSTVPVGTAQAVADIFSEHAAGKIVEVVSNPEFLSEGFALSDFTQPDRVIVGTSSEDAANRMRALYAPFVKDSSQILVFDRQSAEITKYAANAFLATKISFMNELSHYCQHVGANIDNVRKGIGADPRIVDRYLYSGIGYGGSCFPKDVQAIVRSARLAGKPLTILEAVEHVNLLQGVSFANAVIERLGTNLQGKTIAVWGLAFKPDTDDVREAPSFVLIRKFIEHGATVVGYDPVARHTTFEVLGDSIQYAETAIDACRDADALVIATEWDEFRHVNMEEVKGLMAYPLIYDGRNILEPTAIKTMGFEYHSVGR